MSLRTHKNLYHSTVPSETAVDKPSPYRDAYRDKFEELQKYKSPATLFYDIDTLFISYGALKREYNAYWKTHESYTKQIASFLEPQNDDNTMSISIQELTLFIANMKSVESKYNDWMQTVLNKTHKILKTTEGILDKDDMEESLSMEMPSETPSVYRQKTMPIKCNNPNVIKNRSIKASHAKRISHSFSPKDRDNIFNTKSTTTFRDKSTSFKRPRNKKKNKKKRSYKKLFDTEYKTKIKIKKKDCNIRPSHAKKISASFGINNHPSSPISESLSSSSLMTRTKSKKSQKERGRKRANTQNSFEISIDPISITMATRTDSAGSLLSISTFSTTTSPKYIMESPRNSIIRSFGDLYENEFQSMTAKSYANNLETMIEEKQFGHQKTSNSFIYKATKKQLKMVKYYASQIYGQNELFESPFGIRPVIYCDWISSGKPLRCIEDYLSKEMMTLYANTHDAITITGLQTSTYQQEARSIILESVQGQIEQDVVLFCGTSSVDCIYKMANILKQSFIDSGQEYKEDTFVVFVSIYESDSNLYIWKEMGMKVIVIPECNDKGIDLKALETNLKFYSSIQQKQKHKLLIGSFAAASNITGIVSKIDDITLLLHKYDALSFWDYSVGGASMDILMTSIYNDDLSKDAIFISTHRYLGGPGSPGILCAKRKLFNNFVPVIPGDGTMFISYGCQDNQYEYLDNIEEREEAGTPNVIGSVRAALCFMIRDYLSTKFIEERENNYLDFLLDELQCIPNLIIIGDTEMDRLPIISMMITHSNNKDNTKYLHYNFIAALFNDLFGIQGKGGVFHSGMYAKQYLKITDNEMIETTQEIKENNNELGRPGFFRINLMYTLNKEELQYIVNAIKYICNNGWMFLPIYDIDQITGSFIYRDIKKRKETIRSLLDIHFQDNNGKMIWKKKHLRINDNSLTQNFNKYFEIADNILINMKQYLSLNLTKQQFKNQINIINNHNLWYWLPTQLYHDVLATLK